MKAKKHRKVYKNCDLSGQRFGRLHVTSEFGFTGLHRHWICKCDCGKIVKALATNLKRGNTQSCGCLAFDEGWTRPGNDSAHWKGHGKISGHYWSSLQGSAKKRGHLFSISIDEAWVLFEKQASKCALSGLAIKFGDRFGDVQTASLDRINSEKGYEAGNVQWVHIDVNYMKQDYDEERFVEVCRAVYLVAENKYEK